MDLNGDGYQDLLAGSYAGICYIFYGKENGKLKAPKVLKDKTGIKIHAGRYFHFMEKRNVSDSRYKNPDKLNFVKAVDWDNDGDLDLLLSGRKGVKLRINDGDKTKPAFSDTNKDVLPKYNADVIVDWDGDGLWDIISGSDKGGVYFYKNKGVLGKPEFGDAVCLVERSELVDKSFGGESGLTQVAVADYNNDGKLDLIIGNNNKIHTEKFILTEDQIKEKNRLQVKKDSLLQKVYKEIEKSKNKRGKIKIKEGMKSEKAQERWAEFRACAAEYSKYKLPGEYHGYIFVCLRK